MKGNDWSREAADIRTMVPDNVEECTVHWCRGRSGAMGTESKRGPAGEFAPGVSVDFVFEGTEGQTVDSG